MSVTVGIIIAALIAAGIIIIAGFITISLIKNKIKEKYSNYWKIKIKERYDFMGAVPVVEVEVKDLYGNTLGEEKYASIDGCSSSIKEGEVYYN